MPEIGVSAAAVASPQRPSFPACAPTSASTLSPLGRTCPSVHMPEQHNPLFFDSSRLVPCWFELSP